MYKKSVTDKAGNVWDLWVRVETVNKDGFPDQILKKLKKVKSSKKAAVSANVRSVDSFSAVMSTAVFWQLEADIATVPDTTVTLIARNTLDGKSRAVVKDAVVSGKDTSDFDKIQRMLAF